MRKGSVRGRKGGAPGLARPDGFSTVELNIVILVIAVLIIFLLPGMLSLVSDARLSNAKQDAAGIGAAHCLDYFIPCTFFHAGKHIGGDRLGEKPEQFNPGFGIQTLKRFCDVNGVHFIKQSVQFRNINGFRID